MSPLVGHPLGQIGIISSFQKLSLVQLDKDGESHKVMMCSPWMSEDLDFYPEMRKIDGDIITEA